MNKNLILKYVETVETVRTNCFYYLNPRLEIVGCFIVLPFKSMFFVSRYFKFGLHIPLRPAYRTGRLVALWNLLKGIKAAHRFIYGKNNIQYNPLTDSSVIQRNLGGFPKPPRFNHAPLLLYLELLGYPELLIKAAHRFIYGKNNNQYNPLTDSSVIQRNLVGFPKPPRFCYTPIPSYLELLYYPELLIKAAHRFIYGKMNKQYIPLTDSSVFNLS